MSPWDHTGFLWHVFYILLVILPGRSDEHLSVTLDYELHNIVNQDSDHPLLPPEMISHFLSLCFTPPRLPGLSLDVASSRKPSWTLSLG